MQGRMTQTLAITMSKLEGFVLDLANLEHGDRENAYRFLRTWRDFFPPHFPENSAYLRQIAEDSALIDDLAFPPPPSEQEEQKLYPVFFLGELLRRVWREPDMRKKEYRAFLVRRFHHVETSQSSISRTEPPELNAFERAMYHFQKMLPKAKVCANPECAYPYFLATRRQYRFCDPKCALPFQQQYKREWWAKSPKGAKQRHKSRRNK
jgi:hypothetical protein